MPQDDLGVEMVDVGLLHEALERVDQASFVLSLGEPEREPELQAALARLGEVHELLTAVAFAQAVRPQPSVPSDGGDGRGGDDGPALVRRVVLDGDLRAAAAARAFSTATCVTWAVPAAVAGTVVDLTSELVSNAARHAHGPIEVVLERGGDHVQVSVSDGSAEQPQLLPYRSGLSERGIGLRLVDQLSDSWGWTALPQGKRVWARVAVSGRPAPFRVDRRLAAQRRPSSSEALRGHLSGPRDR